MAHDTLEKLREEIDALDRSILEALNRRFSVAQRIARYKNSQNLSLYDPQREESLLVALLSDNSGPLDEDGLEHLFRAIFDESRRIMARETGN